MQLKREELRKIKELAKRKDYDAVVALVDHYISAYLESLVECKEDHRFLQGNLKSLTRLRDDIVITKQ